MAAKRSSGSKKNSSAKSRTPKRKTSRPKARAIKGVEKVGASRRAAKKFGGKMDFGIPPTPRKGGPRLKDVSDEVKFQPAASHRNDPRPPRSGEDGVRWSGVGGKNSGPGSSSGGDLDPEIIGVGTGGTGVAQGGPDEHVSEPELTTGSSDEFASPPPPGVEPRKRRG